MRTVYIFAILLILGLYQINTFASPADLRKMDQALQEQNIKIIYTATLKVPGSFERTNYSGMEFSVLSEEQFMLVYNQLKSRDFANEFKNDGCYAKSHLISYELSRAGIAHGKAIVYGKKVGDILMVEPEKTYEFEFHISPVLMVRGNDGLLRLMVLDFSFFNSPVDLKMWSGKIYSHSNREALTSSIVKPEQISNDWIAGSQSLYGNDLLYRFENEVDAFRFIVNHRKLQKIN